ncbi:alpha/beta fold hydrolase [Gulosibacter bifidus]|uniref:Alpha/beta fold hydrolase n=1 Tax=Gulosibacter bifidus TaxID=272239 RepID=A0ABW5RL80_9MICO|nr:alpha/beta fold hydrolase [Gulosibacter bifidus]
MTNVTASTKQLGDLRLDEYLLTLPLVWGEDVDDRTIDVFARVITRPGGDELPYLVFLQGGPGCEAPRPSFAPRNPSWLDAALADYRVVMLDQRGTGLSTPVSDHDLARGDDELAEYLTHLRADSIVRDCEAVREHLGVAQWSVLGQSFGGFTTLHYLSRYADSLREVYFTGGLSAVGRHCDDVYRTCYDQMRTISERYYRRFPEDREVIRGLVDAARNGEIVLPDGEVVSASRLRSIGHLLGGQDGWQRVHELCELDHRSNAFRYDLAQMLPFGGRNPLYYVIHESSYSDGCVTNWSAERTMPQDFVDDVTLLTGEHVRREWCDTVPAFKPWKGVAERMAQVEWPTLYDADAIRASGVRGAAAVYANDAYVPLSYSLETAELLPNVDLYVTSEYEHGGLRASGGKVLQKLIDLVHDRTVR